MILMRLISILKNIRRGGPEIETFLCPEMATSKASAFFDPDQHQSEPDPHKTDADPLRVLNTTASVTVFLLQVEAYYPTLPPEAVVFI